MSVPAGCLVALVAVVVADNVTKTPGKERAPENPHSTAKMKESRSVLSHPLAAKHPTNAPLHCRTGWASGVGCHRPETPLTATAAAMWPGTGRELLPIVAAADRPCSRQDRDWRPATPQGDGRSSGGRFMTCQLSTPDQTLMLLEASQAC